MSYEYTDHTADAAFTAEGKDLKELFESITNAFYNIITDTEKIKPQKKKQIKIKGKKLRNIIYDYLQELVILQDTEGFIAKKAKIKKATETEIEAELTGDTYKKEYEIKTQIKNATYNEMEIKKEKNKWKTHIVLDI